MRTEHPNTIKWTHSIPDAPGFWAVRGNRTEQRNPYMEPQLVIETLRVLEIFPSGGLDIHGRRFNDLCGRLGCPLEFARLDGESQKGTHA
jgi:hypothetical protein